MLAPCGFSSSVTSCLTESSTVMPLGVPPLVSFFSLWSVVVLKWFAGPLVWGQKKTWYFVNIHVVCIKRISHLIQFVSLWNTWSNDIGDYNENLFKDLQPTMIVSFFTLQQTENQSMAASCEYAWVWLIISLMPSLSPMACFYVLKIFYLNESLLLYATLPWGNIEICSGVWKEVF